MAYALAERRGHFRVAAENQAELLRSAEVKRILRSHVVNRIMKRVGQWERDDERRPKALGPGERHPTASLRVTASIARMTPKRRRQDRWPPADRRTDGRSPPRRRRGEPSRRVEPMRARRRDADDAADHLKKRAMRFGLFGAARVAGSDVFITRLRDLRAVGVEDVLIIDVTGSVVALRQFAREVMPAFAEEHAPDAAR
jgi:hypothetical protein